MRFAYRLGSAISTRLLGAYLARSYEFFLGKRNPALILSAVGEVNGLVNGVVIPALQTVAKIVVAIMLMALLLAVDPLLAICVVIFIGGLYACVFYALRGRLVAAGNRASSANYERQQNMMDALFAFKELKVLHRENHYLSRFAKVSRQHEKDQVTYNLIAVLPRYAIEILAFGAIISILLYLIYLRRDLSQALPLLALYALAGYRLMPAITQIFTGVAHVRFSLASLQHFDRELQALAQSAPQISEHASAVAFTRTAGLIDVVYTYPGAAAPALAGVNLSIQRNTTVGLVGTTGSGKSTAVDVLIGLLQPQRGSLCIDGSPVWQRRIGYVTQSPHIVDDTIARNVALGVPDTEIRMERVREAARLANLAEFIETKLPDRYETKVGDRGSRISGGQRQRLCIARALYHDPEVVVFDEATSAVDAKTEDAIIEAIRTLSHHKTIVMISHRLASLKDCDVIHVFDAGTIIDEGTYESLQARSARFRDLVGIT